MPIARQPEPELMDLCDEAEAYAVADFAEVNARFVDRLLEVVGDRPDARTVDLGTGPADIPLRVAKARPDWHVTAVDGSDAMLQHARQAVEAAGFADRVELVLADAKKTSLPAGAFDVVFSNSILHHIDETHALWAEVRRLASPNATFFFRDLARPESEDEARAIVQRYASDESALLQEEFYRSLLAAYTPDEIRRQLDLAGLGMLEVAMATDRHVDVFGKLS